MLQAPITAAALSRADPSVLWADTCFYPDQFSGRAALASLVALAPAHGVSVPHVSELAARLGIGLPSQVGVQDVLRAADLLGLHVQLERVRPQDLPGKVLPALLLCPHAAPLAQVLVLAHCDEQYAVTHNHASAVPINSMGPVHMLVQQWAPAGTGWCVSVKPQQV